jgi:hypothetical protein
MMTTPARRLLSGYLLSLVVASTAFGQTAATPRFNADIRPLLSQNCFQCHGPDPKHREADLRLDTAEGIAQAFSGGTQKSEGWQRITTSDPDLQMPPPSSHKELRPAEIEMLRRWIVAGASWEGHWAFQSPVKPEIPQVKAQVRVKNPIDAFILARLEQEKLSPSPEADRERLLRRVTFDLTGLPPSLEEIDAFLADASPDAYEKVVDRLLASQHYGERMAVAWLDAARYGDTSVFHADGPRDMWPWRDWVIQAFNNNQPYDQFTIEQLAGDLLPDASLEQKIATGFNRNNATTDEGGAIAEEFRVEYAIDRVKTTSLVWLGLSLECAQCHDHKYDPISQEDYYRFYAYFNQAADPGMQTRGGNQAPLVNVLDREAIAKAESIKQELAGLQQRQAQHAKQALPQFEKWAQQAAVAAKEQPRLPDDLHAYLPLDESEGAEAKVFVGAENRQAKVSGKPQWETGKQAGAFALAGGNYLDAGDVGDFERNQAFSYGAWLKPGGGGNGAVLARMDDGNAHRGYDLFVTGNRVAVHIIHAWPNNAIKINTKGVLKPDAWQHVFVTYDGSSKAAGIQVYFDGQPQEWTIEQDRLSETIRTDKPLYLGRRNPGAPFTGGVDDVRLYGRALTQAEVLALAGSDPIGPLLAKSPAEWNDVERTTLLEHYLQNHDEPYRQLGQQIANLKSSIAASEKPVSTVMVMQDVPSPRATFVLDRGNYHSPNKDQPVEPGVLTELAPLPEDAPGNRLGLAQWLVRPDHPLTARVAVNRWWEMLMGTGLVRSVEDFGAQGEMPSHPALLDWLAVDFVEHGWDVKRTLKQIVMSNTYRQSSRVTPELLERDPENRLLARGPRFRLQGEFIRDNALSASGLLVPTIGGPSVKPYQPPGLWQEVSINNIRFEQDHGEKLYRRSLYTYIKRSAPPPAMLIFDAPSREKCVLRRSRTNTPLQALVTMNDPQFVEAARVLAEQALKQGGATLDEQITFAYRRVTGLQPSALVLETLKQSHAAELEVFAADSERAKKLLAIGESKRDEALDAAQHAALSVICSMILNLDVTLTRG